MSRKNTVERRIADLETKCDTLKRLHDAAADERDELRARLDAAAGQEPVVWIVTQWSGTGPRDFSFDGPPDVPSLRDSVTNPVWEPLYAAPVPAQAVPDGWRLVPVEPTPGMLDAARSQSPFPLGVYRAMITAAPEAAR